MLRSDAFSYINVLDKAADASWLRQTTIANNIANIIISAIFNMGVYLGSFIRCVFC